MTPITIRSWANREPVPTRRLRSSCAGPRKEGTACDHLCDPGLTSPAGRRAGLDPRPVDPGFRRRLQPPRGAADLQGPGGRQHRRLRLCGLRRPRLVNLISNFQGFQEPGGGSTEGDIPLVQDPILGAYIDQIYGLDIPGATRTDLVSIFLTGIEGLNQPAGVKPAEMLRLNTSIAPTPTQTRTGWACWPVRTTASPTGAASATT